MIAKWVEIFPNCVSAACAISRSLNWCLEFVMHVFVSIAACMLVSPASAMTLPISRNYCDEFVTLTKNGIEYEDGSCDFISIRNRVAGGWDVACDEQPLVIEPSKDGNILTLTYPGEFDSYDLPVCPT